MNYKRTTVSFTPEILTLAEQVMEARKFSDFSGFISQLIREDWERRNGPMVMAEGHDAPSAAKPESQVRYTRRARKKKAAGLTDRQKT